MTDDELERRLKELAERYGDLHSGIGALLLRCAIKLAEQERKPEDGPVYDEAPQLRTHTILPTPGAPPWEHGYCAACRRHYLRRDGHQCNERDW